MPGGWRPAGVESWLAASTPEPLFENVADRAGLARPHRAFLPNAAKNIPIPGEHMPPGAAVLDFDRDGRQDLFVPSGDGNRLYRNRGDGTFEDVAHGGRRRGPGGRGRGSAGLRLRQRRGLGHLRDLSPAPEPPLPESGRRHVRGGGRIRGRGPQRLLDLSGRARLRPGRRRRSLRPGLRPSRPRAHPRSRQRSAQPSVPQRRRTGSSPTSRRRRAPTTPAGPWRSSPRISTAISGPTSTSPTTSATTPTCAIDGDGTFDEPREEGRRPRPGLRHGRDRRRLRRRRPARLLRVELFVPAQLVPARPALPHAALPLLSRPAARLAEADEALARLVSLSQPRRRPLHRHVGGGRRLGHLVVLGLRLRRRGPRRPGRPLRRQRHGHGQERGRTGDRLLESHVGRVQNFEKGIPIAEFGDDSLWGRLPKRFYRNRDGRHFDELAAATGLESIGNQRGLVVLDADGDGDPDLFASGFLQPNALWINRNPSRAKTLVVSLEGDPTAAGPPSLHPRGARGDGDRRSRRPLAHAGRLRRIFVPVVRSARALLRPRRRRRKRTASRSAGPPAASRSAATSRPEGSRSANPPEPAHSLSLGSGPTKRHRPGPGSRSNRRTRTVSPREDLSTASGGPGLWQEDRHLAARQRGVGAEVLRAASGGDVRRFQRFDPLEEGVIHRNVCEARARRRRTDLSVPDHGDAAERQAAVAGLRHLDSQAVDEVLDRRRLRPGRLAGGTYMRSQVHPPPWPVSISFSTGPHTGTTAGPVVISASLMASRYVVTFPTGAVSKK